MSGAMGVEKATLSAEWKEGEREWKKTKEVERGGAMGANLSATVTVRAVQNIILSFVPSEQDEPVCYVINDYGSPPRLGRGKLLYSLVW